MQQNTAEKILRIVAEQLAALRKKKGLSHHALAMKAGITRTAISFIESGKRKPTLLITLKLAHALEIELSEILKRAERILKGQDSSA